MKNKLFILFLCILLILLSSCKQVSKSYSFPNKNEPIESIELLYYPFALDIDNEEFMHFELIRQLDTQEIPTFIEQLFSLKTKEVFGSPARDYGQYIARVNYENGVTEYFGSRHIELVEANDQPCAVGIYYFPGDAFEQFFLEYAGLANPYLAE